MGIADLAVVAGYSSEMGRVFKHECVSVSMCLYFKHFIGLILYLYRSMFVYVYEGLGRQSCCFASLCKCVKWN